MRYRSVCLEAFGYTLPDEVVTSAEIEARLAPLYHRLRLPEGRLELMSGIRERRFFAPGTRPGDISIKSAHRAIAASGINPKLFGAIVHGSVCRDFLEPATACHVHERLQLPNECVIYDVSNACLGILNGIVQVANMIELGQIRAGIVVGTECSRELVENTIKMLNEDRSLTRESIKNSMASLTIGSASVAVVLCDEQLSQTDNRITHAIVHSDTTHHNLCQSRGLDTVMDTDSETLMRRGIDVGVETFNRLLGATGWEIENVEKTFCHQVGQQHRKLLLDSLGLCPSIDYSTLSTLGNTGAAALPITMALGAEKGHLEPGDRVAMLGIGSGVNCLMLAAQWQRHPGSETTSEEKLALATSRR
jgi:3-oxoacyl-[acyl-carrier-protein] synthase-3